jgi:hypothetical protein
MGKKARKVSCKEEMDRGGKFRKVTSNMIVGI